jgi:site-specific DNA-methyltransferase (adenine-specific)
VWYYTFGVNCTKKFSRSHVHLFHFVKDDNNFTFNAEDPQVRVPSARALVYADKRANPAGRLPDDTWILRPQDVAEGFQPTDDTWYYARVAGTFKERQGFHGCQMPEQLLGRIIRVSSNADDIVFDPFAGSGTTLAVAKKLGRRWLGCELSAEYVRAASERLAAINDGDSLDGPADPIASAPSTANGRKLESVETSPKAENVDATLPSAGATGSASAVRSPSSKRDVRSVIRDALVESFYASHDGYSIDAMLVQPPLQAAFHESCRDSGLIGGPAEWNRELMRLRKTGGFPKRGDVKKIQVTDEELETYSFAAEIAWRLTSDKFGHSSLDEIFCDPEKATFFDRTAKRFAPGFEPSQYRWAALRLRKASRDLVDEAKRYHFMFTKREFKSFQLWKRFKPSRYSGQPGIYLLRDADKQPLYIGLSIDIGSRLNTHAESRAVADAVEHVGLLIGDDLPGSEYLDAFKEDLIRRHAPTWNVNLVGLNVSV